MRKNFIFRLSMLAVLITMVASCSKKAEYVNAIPADATAVMAVYAGNLVEKAGVEKEKKEKLIESMKSGLSATAFQQIEKIMKDPSESGVSIKDPIYIASAPSLSPVMVMKVTDADKLKASLKVMEGEKINGPVTEADGYNYSQINGGGICAFNETTLIVATLRNDSERTLITNLFKQDANQNILKNPGFQKMQKKKGDMLFFASMDALSSLPARQIGMGLPVGIDLKEIILVGALSYEKGKIVFDMESFSENEEIKAIMKKQEEATGKIKETFLANFPSSTLAFFTLNVNGKKLYDILQENEDFRKNFSLDKAEKTKEIFNSFNGDIAIGLINVTMNDAPTFAAYSEAESGVALDALYAAKADLGLSRYDDIVKLGENEYVYKSRQTNIFFGFKNKFMYATNDELLYKSIGKTNDKSIKDTHYASDIKGKKQFAVIDMKSILELPVVKMLTSFGSEEITMYYNMASTVSHLEIASEGDGKAEICLWFNDKDTNSLKQIIDFASKFAGI